MRCTRRPRLLLPFMLAFAVTHAGAQFKQSLSVGEQAISQQTTPPASVVCNRDQLTHYQGTVSGHSRTPQSISVTISTDWGTEEVVTIEQENGDIESYFLLFNRKFREDDWPLIEEAPGKLLPSVRATVWLCLDDETTPVINWQPGYSRPSRGKAQ